MKENKNEEIKQKEKEEEKINLDKFGDESLYFMDVEIREEEVPNA